MPSSLEPSDGRQSPPGPNQRYSGGDRVLNTVDQPGAVVDRNYGYCNRLEDLDEIVDTAENPDRLASFTAAVTVPRLRRRPHQPQLRPVHLRHDPGPDLLEEPARLAGAGAIQMRHVQDSLGGVAPIRDLSQLLLFPIRGHHHGRDMPPDQPLQPMFLQFRLNMDEIGFPKIGAFIQGDPRRAQPAEETPEIVFAASGEVFRQELRIQSRSKVVQPEGHSTCKRPALALDDVRSPTR